MIFCFTPWNIYDISPHLYYRLRLYRLGSRFPWEASSSERSIYQNLSIMPAEIKIIIADENLYKIDSVIRRQPTIMRLIKRFLKIRYREKYIYLTNMISAKQILFRQCFNDENVGYLISWRSVRGHNRYDASGREVGGNGSNASSQTQPDIMTWCHVSSRRSMLFDTFAAPDWSAWRLSFRQFSVAK